ncbi:MAG: helix-turn-helix transcriptional regulator [Lentisphaeria bacterium]|nr:helix-turn-helix transcriptional regulator [Lentisphaeria bacterium]
MAGKIDFAKVRKWQVQFEVHRPFATLPLPDIVVEEEQSSPAYRQDGRLRGDSGGQLSITLGGRGGIRLAGVDHPLTPGRAFLHNHGDPDVCYYYPADGTEVWNFLWMAFDGDYARSLIAEVNRKYGYLFDVPLNSQLVAKLMSYKNYRNEIQVLSPLEAGMFALDAIGMLCSSKENELRESPRSSLIRDVQTIIATEIAGRLDAESLAKRFRISREHLSRTFREQTGSTLHDYITRARLRMAVDLLLQTRLTAKEIAALCGYTEYSALYRTFRKRLGLSPDELRNNGFRPDI